MSLSCIICASAFSQEDTTYVSRCGHIFHLNCIRQSLARSKTCPHCRQRTTNQSIFRVFLNFADTATNGSVNNDEESLLEDQIKQNSLSLQKIDDEQFNLHCEALKLHMDKLKLSFKLYRAQAATQKKKHEDFQRRIQLLIEQHENDESNFSPTLNSFLSLEGVAASNTSSVP